MISLAPVKDKSTIVKMFKDNSVEYGENSGCLTAVGPDGLMGYSLYSLDSEKMVIYKIRTSIAIFSGLSVVFYNYTAKINSLTNINHIMLI